jgi:hypothetical protein
MKGGYKRNTMTKTTARRKPARRSTRVRNSPRRRSSTSSLKTLSSISIPSNVDEFLNDLSERYGIQPSSARRRPQLIIEESPPVPSVEPIVIESPTEIEIERIPLRTTTGRRTRRTETGRPRTIISNPRPRRTLIIESSSPEEIEVVPRRRLPQNAIILSDSTEVIPLPETTETSISSEVPSISSEEIVSERIPTPIPLIVQNGQPTYAPPRLNGYQAEWHPQTNSYILRRTGRGINIKHKSKKNKNNKKNKIKRKTRKNLQ